ncbi:Kelch-like protein 17 [Eumeta japonica]|uniref:Kelch-like protein 17 n=1 Tax=Eumeta variegata TaxID=151549 RepID=A0A4C1WJV8_EUMVA|nr:Kelch-like protein 17 [Eumeta japonica]
MQLHATSNLHYHGTEFNLQSTVVRAIVLIRVGILEMKVYPSIDTWCSEVATADARTRGCTFYIVKDVYDSSETMLSKYNIYKKQVFILISIFAHPKQSIPEVDCGITLYGHDLCNIPYSAHDCFKRRSLIALPASSVVGRRYRRTSIIPEVVKRSGRVHRVWKNVPAPCTRRHDPGVAALGGRLYVVGGVEGSPAIDDIERWLPAGANDAQEAAGSVSRPCLLAGGEVYDPVTDKLSPIAAMNEARSHFALVALKGKLYALGGRGVGGELSSVEVYDPVADAWAPAGRLPRPMAGASAVTYGGESAARAVIAFLRLTCQAIYLMHLRSLLRFHPSARQCEQWHSCADMNLLRYGHGAAVLHNQLYVMGGRNNQGDALETVERYNFTTDSWQFATSKLTRRGRCAAGAAGGVLLAVDGPRLEVYDADEDRWTPGPDKPGAYDVTGAAVLW